MKEMTGKQREVYDFICQAISGNGYPPTVREIGENFSISVKGAYDHLKAIERKGFIKCSSSKSRAIEVMKQMDSFQMNEHDMMRVPLLGQTQAGMPILAEQNTEEEYYLPKSLLGDTELFALRVKGDSMKNAGIHNGDLALIRMQNYAENGEIVVALLDNEATIKRFYRDATVIRLEPENDAYKPIICSSVEILGRVVWVFRRIM